MFTYLSHKGRFQLSQEVLGHFFGYGYLVDVNTYLPGIEQFEERDLTGRIFEVGIFANDAPVSGLAA